LGTAQTNKTANNNFVFPEAAAGAQAQLPILFFGGWPNSWLAFLAM
jgi:hypothetical protein